MRERRRLETRWCLMLVTINSRRDVYREIPWVRDVWWRVIGMSGFTQTFVCAPVFTGCERSEKLVTGCLM